MRVNVLPCRRGLAVWAGVLMLGCAPAVAREPADVAGVWDLSLAKSHASCRIILQAQRSDRGDYFLSMPAPCRHAMPGVERVGRWTMPDPLHLALEDPSGTPVLTFIALDKGFSAAAPEGTYALAQIGPASPAAAAPAREPAAIIQVASRRPAADEPHVRPSDLAGRYAVMRDKHDTGCMVTLDDKTRGKGGGDRAQLAPGCRDQGIVIFDPSAWQIVKDELVLTARAGHKARLQKDDDGVWQKDPKDGGRPLGLKKL